MMKRASIMEHGARGERAKKEVELNQSWGRSGWLVVVGLGGWMEG